MDFRPLGHSGLKVSAIGLGCNNFGQSTDAAASAKVVDKAIDLGVSFFDTADFYGNEKGTSEIFLGKALGKRRHDVVIASKFGGPMGDSWSLRGGGSRDYILRAVEASLRRLGTDYIDLYQPHFADTATPIEETLRAMDDLVRQGKVRYLGISNFDAWQITDAAWTAKALNLTPCISAENRYSVLTRGMEREVVPACVKHGLGILPYFPLEAGVLTGKYTDMKNLPPGSRLADIAASPSRSFMTGWFLNEQFMTRAKQLADVAKEGGATLLQLAIGWLLSRPYVGSVITGASNGAQLEANVKAATWRPTPEQLKRIDEISPPPKMGPF